MGQNADLVADGPARRLDTRTSPTPWDNVCGEGRSSPARHPFSTCGKRGAGSTARRPGGGSHHRREGAVPAAGCTRPRAAVLRPRAGGAAGGAGGAAEDDMEAAKGARWAARAPRPRPKSAGGAPARGAPGPVGDGCRGRVARRWPERWQCSQCWEPRGAWWACGGARRDDEAGAGAPGGRGNCAGGGRLRTQARA